MSDQINSFDEVFRSKLSEHTVSPPDFVWEKIEAKRTFGHIVANKISINWRIFGTMLLLLLGGGSSAILFGGEEQAINQYPIVSNQDIEKIFTSDNHSNNAAHSISLSSISAPDQTAEEVQVNVNEPTEKPRKLENHIPGLELMASINQAAFTKPIIRMDKRLNAYIQQLDGWGSAKPRGFAHYYNMSKMNSLGFIEKSTETHPILSDIEYDYAQPVTKKSFKERTSILLAFTPQSITKMMVAEYNLSSSYLRHRESSEQTRMAYTFEANMHYELKNHKFFETGLNFTQIYEEMSFKGEKRFSNQYDFVEIPLLLGYEDRNSKWGYQVKGGFGLQVFGNQKGYIYKKYDRANPIPVVVNNPQYRMKKGSAVRAIFTGNHTLSKNQDPDEVLDLSKEEENPYKDNGVVNFHLSAGLTYYHSIRTTFVIAPYYRRNINSITKESALFNEKITYMGISFGTRISF